MYKIGRPPSNKIWQRPSPQTLRDILGLLLRYKNPQGAIKSAKAELYFSKRKNPLTLPAFSVTVFTGGNPESGPETIRALLFFFDNSIRKGAEVFITPLRTPPL